MQMSEPLVLLQQTAFISGVHIHLVLVARYHEHDIPKWHLVSLVPEHYTACPGVIKTVCAWQRTSGLNIPTPRGTKPRNRA